MKDHQGYDTKKRTIVDLLKEAYAYHVARKSWMEREKPNTSWNSECTYSTGWISCLLWVASILADEDLYDEGLLREANKKFE